MPIETPPNESQDYDPAEDPDTGPPLTGDDTTTDNQAEGEDE